MADTASTLDLLRQAFPTALVAAPSEGNPEYFSLLFHNEVAASAAVDILRVYGINPPGDHLRRMDETVLIHQNVTRQPEFAERMRDRDTIRAFLYATAFTSEDLMQNPSFLSDAEGRIADEDLAAWRIRFMSHVAAPLLQIAIPGAVVSAPSLEDPEHFRLRFQSDKAARQVMEVLNQIGMNSLGEDGLQQVDEFLLIDRRIIMQKGVAEILLDPENRRNIEGVMLLQAINDVTASDIRSSGPLGTPEALKAWVRPLPAGSEGASR